MLRPFLGVPQEFRFQDTVFGFVPAPWPGPRNGAKVDFPLF
jgi:hypothetical protein